MRSRFSVLLLLIVLECISPSAKATNSLGSKGSSPIVLVFSEYDSSIVVQRAILSDSLIPKKAKHTKTHTPKRWVAATLAFPLPFGVFGIHRLYMGTSPIVPVVYTGTFGGCLGTLPFIDFVLICLDRDWERFQNNPQVFMWSGRK